MVTRRKKTKDIVDAKSTKIVSTTLSLSGNTTEEDETKKVEIEVFETDPAYIRASAGMTKNLGNYESLRVDVSITMPCYKEQVRETYDNTADEVSALLYEEIDKYLQGDSSG